MVVILLFVILCVVGESRSSGLSFNWVRRGFESHARGRGQILQRSLGIKN